jgi:hypothetical protein
MVRSAHPTCIFKVDETFITFLIVLLYIEILIELKGVERIEIIIALIVFGMLWFFVIGPILRGLGNTVDGVVGFGNRDNWKTRIQEKFFMCRTYQIMGYSLITLWT